MWCIKLRNKTVKIKRNGHVFQVDTHFPRVCYFGGGGTEIEQISNLTSGQGRLLNALSQQVLSQFQGPQAGQVPQAPGDNVFSRLLQASIGEGDLGQLQGVTPFQGIRPGEVPFSPLQEQALGLAGELAPGIGAGIDLFGQAIGGFDPAQSQELLGQATRNLEGATQPFDPQTILDALEPGRQLALRTFERDITPNILERFGATSAASGALDKALAEAGAGLSLGLGAQAFPFLAQGQESQLNRQLQGAGLAGNLAQLPGLLAGQGTALGGQATDLLSQLFNIGGAQRSFPQGLAQAEQARFGEAQPFANPFLLNLAPLALGTPAFQNIGVQQPPGALSPLLGGLGTLAGAGGLGAFGNILGTTGVGGMTSGLGAGTGLLGGLSGLGGLAGGALAGLGGAAGGAAAGIGSALTGLLALI